MCNLQPRETAAARLSGVAGFEPDVKIQYEAPYNYTDFDVTSEIDCHRNYYKEDEGVVDQIVAQW